MQLQDKQPDIRPVQWTGRVYVLVQDFNLTHNNYTFNIPAGFQTNGASTPKWLWPVLLSRDGVHRAAVLIHDYCYAGHVHISRKTADQIFRDMMINYGVPKIRAWIAYCGVRIFGSLYWQR